MLTPYLYFSFGSRSCCSGLCSVNPHVNLAFVFMCDTVHDEVAFVFLYNNRHIP